MMLAYMPLEGAPTPTAAMVLIGIGIVGCIYLALLYYDWKHKIK